MPNPLEIFYCWQALLLALVVYMLTQLVKTTLPFIVNVKSIKAKAIIKRVVMPAVPPLLGFICGALIPLHPEVLNAYVHESINGNWIQNALIFGGWGAAVGQFADYVYSKISKLIGDMNIARPQGGNDNNEAA